MQRGVQTATTMGRGCGGRTAGRERVRGGRPERGSRSGGARRRRSGHGSAASHRRARRAAPRAGRSSGATPAPAPIMSSFVPCAGRAGHVSVGSLDEHPRAGRSRRQPLRAVAGDAGRDRRGRRRSGSAGERERVAARPAGAVDESPDEELAGTGAQLVQVASSHPHGHSAVAVALDGRHADAVSRRPQQRHARCGTPGRMPPPRPRAPTSTPWPAGEDRKSAPVHSWCGQRESDAEVGVQVQQVPGLVAQLLAARARIEVTTTSRMQQRAGRREQHAGVVPDELPQLHERIDGGGGGVARGRGARCGRPAARTTRSRRTGASA